MRGFMKNISMKCLCLLVFSLILPIMIVSAETLPEAKSVLAEKEAIPNEAAMKEKIKAEAQNCADAFVKGDFEKLSLYTHPKIMQMLGGREKMSEITRQVMKQMEKQGMSFISAKIGEPLDLKKIGRVYCSFVPQNLQIKTAKGMLQVEGWLLGVLETDGKWYFIDCANRDAVKQLFPEIASALQFPEKKAPKLVKEN